MASSDDSTPSQWQELHPFRSTFLRHIHEPETAEALRKTGSFLFAAALEIAIFTPDPERSDLQEDLAAAAADLRYLAGFLEKVVAAAYIALELPEEDGRLSMRGFVWASKVGEIAAEIEGALSP